MGEQERQRQQKRREALQEAQSALRLGKTLAKQRDKGKRSLDDMVEYEQKMLKDYDTGYAKRAKQANMIDKTAMKPFRCQLDRFAT